MFGARLVSARPYCGVLCAVERQREAVPQRGWGSEHLCLSRIQPVRVSWRWNAVWMCVFVAGTWMLRRPAALHNDPSLLVPCSLQ
ncbi:hypothetical protein BCR37DRAFT_105442 [Protomyces lactucae-debilis]|uniref:Uncharacterized protein n=1 Tax=Protomyces lactucae-debilis TaxID=2754530 RepID=A0A1Y2F6G4_PROLT|nr:uncharacterized protein BCR37DRAFT_105442 [Protomyces lactucae-debilis]ORY78525.1 hypothetical protein BCR37DRAFT_105442 [Protomyces lactucae-debilis]